MGREVWIPGLPEEGSGRGLIFRAVKDVWVLNGNERCNFDLCLGKGVGLGAGFPSPRRRRGLRSDFLGFQKKRAGGLVLQGR